MPAKGKRSLPVDEATHREIAIESATIGRDMYLLVADAWAAYKRERASKRTPDPRLTQVVADHVEAERKKSTKKPA